MSVAGGRRSRQIPSTGMGYRTARRWPIPSVRRHIGQELAVVRYLALGTLQKSEAVPANKTK
ncbi:hypothetical protein NJB1604_24150 [Mycobacterium marinum]|nr:hypothetical protein NJB1604_24150 [Mycobacterium marinum]